MAVKFVLAMHVYLDRCRYPGDKGITERVAARHRPLIAGVLMQKSFEKRIAITKYVGHQLMCLCHCPL